MQPFSIVISRQAWYAKNLLSGKERSGYFNDLPDSIATQLNKLISPKTVCVTTTIKIPNESEFNIWFNRQ